MKKTFLAKRNALLSPTNLSWGSFSLAFALLVLCIRLLFPNFFLYLFAPAFGASSAIAETSHSFFNSFSNIAALAKRNEQLAEENAALANENQALMKKAESISSLGADTLSSGILAGVVARPPESPYDTLILSAGERAGAALGMEVFADGGVPVGVISLVTADFSVATLFSAPHRVTRGWTGNANTAIDIFGAGAGAMQATLSRSATVSVGDTVFAPGPGMLPIGTVARIDSDPSTPENILRIVPSVNIFSLSWVLLRDTGTSLLNSFSVATSTL